ncbi:Hypothetical predicted protein [Olea europaea subsp. europaea]|uniref:Uncharacterized protein n=1 Tax=Olea europaea subsp. europaea TaxID=158383 RepID=A0A8S0PHL8_OLEEU|nr:Hypothetical predicted protein [Olea europaea subsp. europaea]
MDYGDCTIKCFEFSRNEGDGIDGKKFDGEKLEKVEGGDCRLKFFVFSKNDVRLPCVVAAVTIRSMDLGDKMALGLRFCEAENGKFRLAEGPTRHNRAASYALVAASRDEKEPNQILVF